MALLDLLATNTVWLLTFTALLGLMVGSFLNVVIHRLPLIMERDWRDQCAEFLEQPEQAPTDAPLSLSRPRSHCPHCRHAIGALENIPVISYLWLRGKCSGCGIRISPRYPVIEIVTALLSVTIAWHFGFSWLLAGGLLLTWSLIALTMIDFDHQLLPDNITLPLLWLGLVFNLGGAYTDIDSAVIGAMAGYLSLWSIYWLFKLLTGKEGMGFGDFKLLALLGAWLGWQALPVIILLSSAVGAVIGIGLIVLRGRDRNIPIPFGPYLAIAGWITFLWGEWITQTYLQFAGIGLP
ncbi:MAG: A24 family peptidase [Gammaproteobacteria bacterium]|nr:A24 family peptidase [Gammaproteobacteria bacterium]